jgi:tetratricopeptide (TPR) repeat protein
MTDEKSPSLLEQIAASNWGKVVAFLAAATVITNFVLLFQKHFIIVSLVILGLITILLAIGSFGWKREKIPGTPFPVTPAKTKKRSLLSPGWLKVFRIAFGFVIFGWIAWGIYIGISYQQERIEISELKNKVVILIAEIDGPDPKNYRVTEQLIDQLNTSLKGYEDVLVLPLGEIISEQQGVTQARTIGAEHYADIVLWGYYGVTSTDVQLTLHVENLQPETISVIEAGETMQTQAAIDALNSFTFQQDVSSQMASLTFYISGYARYQAEDYLGALELFDKAISQSSWADDFVNLEDALYIRGFTHIQLGNWEQAISDYSETILIDPDNFTAHFNRAFAYYEQGDLEAAIRDYGLAIQLDPMYADSYYNRGIAYYDLGDFDSTIQDMDQAIQLDPNSADIYTMRGRAYRAKGDFETAIRDYDQAIQSDSTYAYAYYNRGNAYDDLGDPEAAIRDYDQAILLNPNYAAAFNIRARVYYQQGDLKAAIRDYDQAIQLDHTEATTFNNRALAYYEQGDLKAAIRDYDQAIQLDPKLADAYYNRGIAYNDQGDLEAAIQDLGQVIQLDPNSADTYYHRGNAYTAQGELAAAIQDYQKYLDLGGGSQFGNQSEIEQTIISLKDQLGE